MAAKKTSSQQAQVTFAASAPDGVKPLWEPNPGPQTEVFLRDEYEILYGGAKGGGKTVAGRMWLLRGNLSSQRARHSCPSDGRPCRYCATDISYINNPDYRALVLRLNRKDADTWVDESFKIYKPMGARLVESPTTEFIWPSGARFIVDHMADDSVWQKYAGNAIVRMVVEEAGQIPNYRRYADVKINCRSGFEEMKPQVLLTANPGGPGHSWLMKRFMLDRPDTYKITLREWQIHPVTKEKRPVTRVFIPAKLADNQKWLENDPDYGARLMADLADDPHRKRALLDGDWTALAGTYFGTFRPKGPLAGEPPEANHVIPADSVFLRPWFHRWLAMDWGFQHNSAVYWGCTAPDGRVYVYRELVRTQTGTFQMGVEIARASLSDLEGLENHTMTLWLSPDAFGKRNDEKTFAEQIAAGIESVLGPDSCVLLTAEDTKNEDFHERLAFQRGASIILRAAINQRTPGWQYIRELLRFKPAYTAPQPEIDWNYAFSLVKDGNNHDKYDEYVRSFARLDQKKEALPKIQIFDSCRRLIEAIPLAVYDERNPEDVNKEHFEGMDSLDAFRYLCVAHKQEQKREPFAEFQQRRMDRLSALHPEGMDGNMLTWVNRKAEADYAAHGDAPGHIFISRASSRRAKVM